MVRDENNARFTTLTVTIEECRAEARRYIKTLKAKADPSRCGARNDDSGPKVQFLGTPTRTRAKAENNVGINKNAGLRGRRFVSTTELTLNETCQNPDGTRELLAP